MTVDGRPARVVQGVRSVVPMQPVSLGGLAPADRALSAVALLIAGFWCVLFIAAAAGWKPGTAADWGWMGTSGQAALVRIMTYGSLGLAGVLGVRAALGWRSWMRRVVLLVVALVMYYVARGSAGYSTAHGMVAAVTRQLSNAGVVAALLLVVLPLSARWQRRVAVGLVVLGAAVPVSNLALAGQLTHPWHAMVDLRSDALWRLMMSLQTFFVLYLFWNLITWARLLGQWSKATGDLMEQIRRVLVAALVAKLAWELAGLAGVLPSFLGGSSQAWVAARHDGWASWLTAAVLVALGAVWLWRRPAPADATDPRPPDAAPLPATEHLLLFAGVLAAPAVIAALLQMRPNAGDVRSTAALLVIAGAVAVAVAAGWSAATGRAHRGLLALGAGGLAAAAVFSARVSLAPNQATGHYLLAPLAAFLLAAWVCWRGEKGAAAPTERHRSLQICAAAFCALLAGVVIFHIGPRLRQLPFPFDTGTVGASGDTLFNPTAGADQYKDVAPSWERWWHGPGGTFEPVTLDTCVTVAAGMVLIESRRRRRRFPPGLAAVVVASTIYAHSATLSPTSWAGHSWFYLAFAFPVVMTVAVDARELNAPHPERGRRLIGTLAAILLLITVAGWSLVTFGLTPSLSLADMSFGFTRGLTLPFFLAAVLAAVIGGAVDTGGRGAGRHSRDGNSEESGHKMSGLSSYSLR